MSAYWSPLVDNLSPYVPGEQPSNLDIIKLNTNENPYGPSPDVFTAIKQNANHDLRRYPDPESDQLKTVIANYYNLGRENVFLGNGSDEVLAFVFRALFSPRLPVLFPAITYSFYPVYAKLFELPYKQIPLNANYEINAGDYFGNSALKGAGGIIFANPNAPTGIVMPVSEIEKIVQYNPDCNVVVDEAYVDFGAESAISLINKYDNLLIVQTTSKSRSLAGMRVGMAMGNARLIEGLNRVKNSFNSYPLDRLAQVAAIASFQDNDHFNTTRQSVISSRRRLTAELEQLGFTVLPSQANFLLVSHPNYSSEPDFAIPLLAQLKRNNILVRHFDSIKELRKFVRITIGTIEQNKLLVDALKLIINSD